MKLEIIMSQTVSMNSLSRNIPKRVYLHQFTHTLFIELGCLSNWLWEHNNESFSGTAPEFGFEVSLNNGANLKKNA